MNCKKYNIMKKILLMFVALFAATTMLAADFITDVMVIGGSKNETNALKASYAEQGWTVINKNLNEGAGGDYIFLLYKSASDADEPAGYITDFLIATVYAPSTIKKNNRTYYLVPCDGSSDFISSFGNLNNGMDGKRMFLYYYKDNAREYWNSAVSQITFDNSSTGSGVVYNDSSMPADLNQSSSSVPHIYMHTVSSPKSQRWKIEKNTDGSLCYINGLEGDNLSGITSVIVPLYVDGASVLNFDDMSFYESGVYNLESLNFFSETLISIMPAVRHCTKMRHVNYYTSTGEIMINRCPPSIRTIPNRAFVSTDIDSLEMMNVTEIGDYAFTATHLSYAYIYGNNEIFVSPYAFSFYNDNYCEIHYYNGKLDDCDPSWYLYSPNLVIITMGDHGTCGWCGSPLDGYQDNLYWQLDANGHLTIDCFYGSWIDYPQNQLIYSHNWNKSKVKLITLEHVDTIAKHEFQEYPNLETLQINSGLRKIGEFAFNDCPKLNTVYLPSCVTKIGNGAFRNCELLSDLYFDGTDAQWNAMIREANWNNYVADDFKAHWHCTVTFDSNGYGTAPASQSIEWSNEDKVTEPTAPTAPGSVFTGWYTDAACTTLWNFDDVVTGDMTLYAGWRALYEPIEVTAGGVRFNMIKVDGNDGISTFYIGECEVTEALWLAVMGGENPSSYKGNLADNLPVESISWNDCQAFLAKLKQMTKLDFRLPAKAEWVYAASGGKNSQGFAYSGSNTVDAVAWYKDNCSQKMTVGTKAPNELGIHDMSGNVYEIIAEATGVYGGGWHSSAGNCSVGYYWSADEAFTDNDTGLRLALTNFEPIQIVVTGDVDGSGTVDGADLNMLINIILGKLDATDATVKGEPNVDGQGGIDGSDLNALINIILGK